MKHTKGPWSNRSGTLKAAAQLARTISTEHGEGEVLANMRLILAAPSLVMTLEIARKEFERISYQKKADPEVLALIDLALSHVANGEFSKGDK